jgi:arylsulfatase A-like enzyme
MITCVSVSKVHYKLTSALIASFVLQMILRAAPNVILIYADDLGYGDLGVMGHPVIQTPHLDKLASESLLLTRYYAPSPLCSPSRAGLLTGRTPYRTGIKSWIPHGSDIYLRTEETTIAELLKDAGYATALIGKWHLNSDLGNTSEPQPHDHGFDYAYGHNAFQIPNNHNPTNIFRNGEALPMQEGYTAQLYVDEAMSWLDEYGTGESPFFLYLSMAEPHTQIANPPEFNAIYAQYTRGEIVPGRSGEGIPSSYDIRGPGEYYANITYLDFQLGRLLEDLDRRGLRENTLIIFSSDNGPVTSDWINWHETNSYGSTGGYRGRKHYLYDGGLRVPTMLRLPGVIPVGTSDALTVGMDLFTTIAHLCEVKIPDDRPIDGIDLAPLFSGDPLHREEPLFWGLPWEKDKEFAFRSGPWKLLLSPELEPIELYHIESDHLEFFNRIQEETEVVDELTEAFKSYYASIQDDPFRPK